MSRSITRLAVLGTVTAAMVALPAGSASATPACKDRVARALHVVHDTSGDPAGIAHEVEETYCSVS